MKYSNDFLTAVCFQNTDFWIVMPCSLVGENKRFGKNMLPPSSGSIWMKEHVS